MSNFFAFLVNLENDLNVLKSNNKPRALSYLNRAAALHPQWEHGAARPQQHWVTASLLTTGRRREDWWVAGRRGQGLGSEGWANNLNIWPNPKLAWEAGRPQFGDRCLLASAPAI